MKRNQQIFLFCGVLIAILVFVGCDKSNPYEITIPKSVAHFVGSSSQLYAINDANPPAYTITVGTTDVQNSDREISFSITSPTGAVEGEDFTLSSSGKVIIPAGKALGTISIQADADHYPAGKKDTLIFTLLESGEVPAAQFSNSLKLTISGPCSDAEVDLEVMSGIFGNTTDADGKYTVTISNLTETSSTTGQGTITNIWGDIAPVDILFDWTDPDDITVSIPMQYMGYDYDVGQPMVIRTSPGKSSRFSVCSQTLTLYVDFIVQNYPSPGSAAYYYKEFLVNVAR